MWGYGMFSTIVIGTDGSDTARGAVAMAAQIARQNSASLHLVSVARSAAGVGGGGLASGNPIGGEALLTHATNVMLEEMKSELQGLDVTTYSEMGAPAAVIVRYADKVGADLIVVGSKGMRGTHRIIGSVPNSVAHNAGCNVLIAKTV
jgi:nucleotide-binding universal stress UspA family protein